MRDFRIFDTFQWEGNENKEFYIYLVKEFENYCSTKYIAFERS